MKEGVKTWCAVLRDEAEDVENKAKGNDANDQVAESSDGGRISQYSSRGRGHVAFAEHGSGRGNYLP